MVNFFFFFIVLCFIFVINIIALSQINDFIIIIFFLSMDTNNPSGSTKTKSNIMNLLNERLETHRNISRILENIFYNLCNFLINLSWS